MRDCRVTHLPRVVPWRGSGDRSVLSTWFLPSVHDLLLAAYS